MKRLQSLALSMVGIALVAAKPALAQETVTRMGCGPQAEGPLKPAIAKPNRGLRRSAHGHETIWLLPADSCQQRVAPGFPLWLPRTDGNPRLIR